MATTRYALYRYWRRLVTPHAIFPGSLRFLVAVSTREEALDALRWYQRHARTCRAFTVPYQYCILKPGAAAAPETLWKGR